MPWNDPEKWDAGMVLLSVISFYNINVTSMSVMASQMTQANNKENIKILHSLPFVRVSGFLYRESVIRKSFPVMT